MEPAPTDGLSASPRFTARRMGAEPPTRDLRVFEYRPFGDPSDGITVTVQGLRRLIATGAIEPQVFECREVGHARWQPLAR